MFTHLPLPAEILVTLIALSLRNHSSVTVSRSMLRNSECVWGTGAVDTVPEKGSTAATVHTASNSTVEYVSKHVSKMHFKINSQKIWSFSKMRSKIKLFLHSGHDDLLMGGILTSEQD